MLVRRLEGSKERWGAPVVMGIVRDLCDLKRIKQSKYMQQMVALENKHSTAESKMGVYHQQLLQSAANPQQRDDIFRSNQNQTVQLEQEYQQEKLQMMQRHSGEMASMIGEEQRQMLSVGVPGFVETADPSALQQQTAIMEFILANGPEEEGAAPHSSSSSSSSPSPRRQARVRPPMHSEPEHFA
ncbi:hypothetical protein T484DRAFT_1878145, partial [Baffinella frigidus]